MSAPALGLALCDLNAEALAVGLGSRGGVCRGITDAFRDAELLADAVVSGFDGWARASRRRGALSSIALGTGRSTSASGTVVKPKVWWDSRVDGNETVTYKIKVKRVK